MLITLEMYSSGGFCSVASFVPFPWMSVQNRTAEMIKHYMINIRTSVFLFQHCCHTVLCINSHITGSSGDVPVRGLNDNC